MWTEYEGSTISGTSIGAREGAALASASTVVLTDFYHQITGTTQVNTFIFAGNVTSIFTIRPTGAFPIGTGGNIKGAPAVATVDALMLFMYDGTDFRYIGGAAANGTATSVLGRSVNSSGIRADIAATSNYTYLRRVEDVLGFGDMPSFNPEDFAGVDSRAKIQAAINAAETAGGGRIVFTRDYTINSTDGNADSTQETTILIDGSKVLLDGQRHTITFATGALSRMVIVRNTTDVTIRDLNFINTMGGSTDIILGIQDSNQVKIDTCTFKNVTTGILVSEDTSLRGDTTNGDNVIRNVKNVSRWTVGDEIAGPGIGNGSVTVTVSAIDTVNRTLTLQSGGVAHNVTATDTDVILFNRTTGGCDDVLIRNCTFDTCSLNGISHFPKATSYNSHIVDNKLINCGLGVAGGSSIKCGQSTYNAIVAGNTIMDTTGYAISVGLSEHISYAATYERALFIGNAATWTGTNSSANGIDINGGDTLAGGTQSVGPVIFRGNSFSRPFCGFLLRPTKPVVNVVLDGNYFYNQQTVSVADAASGGAPSGLVLMNNVTRNTDSTKTVTWRIEGDAVSPTITGNTFIGCSAQSLRLDAADPIVANNRFIEGNLAGTASAAAIYINSGADVTTVRVHGNLLDNRALSPGYAYLVDNVLATGATIVNRNNVAQSGTIELRTATRSADHSSVALTAQGAAIAATALLTAPPAGRYRINYFHEITRAATTSSATQLTIGYTSAAAQSDTGTNITGNTVGAKASGSITIEVVSGDITYAASYSSSGATTMQYRLSINVERLY